VRGSSVAASSDASRVGGSSEPSALDDSGVESTEAKPPVGPAESGVDGEYTGPGEFATDGSAVVWIPNWDFPDPFASAEHGELSMFSGLYEERQNKLSALGYRPAGNSKWADGIWGDKSVGMTELFQNDWNWFVGYLESVNPDIQYKPPYTRTSTDGFWGPETDSRINKALGKLDGDSEIYVDELGYSVGNFKEMIEGLKGSNPNV